MDLVIHFMCSIGSSVCKYLFSWVQMDEHEKALSLLAHKLKDYQGAEKHCIHYSQVSGAEWEGSRNGRR